MDEEIPKLSELAEQMVAEGAQLLRVNAEMLRSRYLLVTAHGREAALGSESSRYAEYRSIGSVRIDDERFQFDYEFDPFGPSTLGSLPLYVAEAFDASEAGGFEATSIEEGLNTILEESTGGSE